MRGNSRAVVRVTGLRPNVRAALLARGIEPAEGESPAALKQRLNDAYLVEIRRLKEAQASGDIPLRDYAGRVAALKESFALLGLPLHLWTG